DGIRDRNVTGVQTCALPIYLDFDHVTSFNLDEYVGLDESHPGSYKYYMKEKLFDHVNIPEEKAHVPSGIATDLESHCKAYEEKIAAAGRIDLQILGIGVNGHIGFNETGTSFESRTHVVVLKESTREVNSRILDSYDEVKTEADTMGIMSSIELYDG